MSIVVDRYERLAISQLRDLRELQRKAMNPSTDSASVRSQIDRIGQHLQSGLAQLLGERENLDADGQDQFDARVEPIRCVIHQIQFNDSIVFWEKIQCSYRKQIQSAIHATASLPPLESKNPFEEPDSVDSNPYEAERKRYVQETDSRALELKAKAEEARMVAEATAKLNKDMRDLEDIFAELATIVHEQHDVVDSIEEHIERATHDVKHGNEQLKKAVRSKTNRATVTAAVVGGVAVGGPVGLAAGSAVAGISAGVAGLVAGIYGGKWFRNSVRKDCDINN
ncbi:hypothetical protein Y032_0234g3141 [Ancylostoma ceylanicum]|nr:hypothetical protein Y032_0234g3141 [Ancylostoma ceylanicum]